MKTKLLLVATILLLTSSLSAQIFNTRIYSEFSMVMLEDTAKFITNGGNSDRWNEAYTRGNNYIYASEFVTFDLEEAQDSSLKVAIDSAITTGKALLIGESLKDTLYLKGRVNLPSGLKAVINCYVQKLTVNTVNVVGNYVEGDSIIALASVEGFEVGDLVAFYDSRFPNSGGSGCKNVKSCLSSYKITAINGDSLVFSQALHDTIPGSSFSSVAFLYNNLFQADGQSNIHISGSGIVDFNKANHPNYVSGKYVPEQGNNRAAYEPACAFLFNNCANITIEGLEVKNAINHNISYDYVNYGFMRGLNTHHANMKNILNIFGRDVKVSDSRADSSTFEDGVFIYGFPDLGYNNKVVNCLTYGNARGGITYLSQVNMLSAGNFAEGNGINLDFWLSSGTSFQDKAQGGRVYTACTDTLQSVKLERCSNFNLYDLEIQGALKTAFGAEGNNTNVNIYNLSVDTAEVGYSDLPFQGVYSVSIDLYTPIFENVDQQDDINPFASTTYITNNWDSAYSYSQVDRMPLTGDTLTGTLGIQKNENTQADLQAVYVLNTNNNASLATSTSIKLGVSSTVGTNIGTLKLTEGGNNSTAGNFSLTLPFGGSEFERLSVLGNGNVGIGVSVPTEKLEVDGSLEVGSSDWIYFGDSSTDGSYRIGRSGNNLVTQRRESGSWVTKQTISP